MFEQNGGKWSSHSLLNWPNFKNNTHTDGIEVFWSAHCCYDPKNSVNRFLFNMFSERLSRTTFSQPKNTPLGLKRVQLFFFNNNCSVHKQFSIPNLVIVIWKLVCISQSDLHSTEPTGKRMTLQSSFIFQTRRKPDFKLIWVNSVCRAVAVMKQGCISWVNNLRSYILSLLALLAKMSPKMLCLHKWDLNS